MAVVSQKLEPASSLICVAYLIHVISIGIVYLTFSSKVSVGSTLSAFDVDMLMERASKATIVW